MTGQVAAQDTLISVGIPTYNRPEGLRRALDRVTRQTYRNLEIIVSDNCTPDESAVASVMRDFVPADRRVRFFRQKENLGSVGNFWFLLQQAMGRFFLWVADDDEIELNYIQTLAHELESHPQAAIAMTGYDVNDCMAEPRIQTDLSRHLYALRAPAPYARLRNYLRQPDHLGKSRIVWGLHRREVLTKSFADCVRAAGHPPKPTWAELPIELRGLASGDLAVAPAVLFHVNLLPTSDGKAGLAHDVGKLFNIVDRAMAAYTAVVEESPLTARQKRDLSGIIRRKRWLAKIQLFGYYGVLGKMPGLARWIKRMWFWFA